jgi:hypothetical protein
MKYVLSFIFLFMVLGSAAAAGGAQQKRSGPADTVKAAMAVNDSAAKKDSVAAAVRFGRIKVTATPETAEVSVDSIARGTSPLTLDSLKPGAHVLIIKQKGYFGKKVSVDVMPDSTLTIDVALVKPAAFFVASAPAGAKVIFDGKESGVTPYENAKVKPGDHTVRLEKEQFAPLDLKIAATEGKTDSLSFALVALKPQAAQPAPQQPAAKRGIDTVILVVLTSLVVIFGIAIFAAESGSK